MGVRLLRRWTRGPVLGMGICPAKRPARDAQAKKHQLLVEERA